MNNELLFKISPAESGVGWDLFYYEITDFEIIENEQQLEEDELIEGNGWSIINIYF